MYDQISCRRLFAGLDECPYLPQKRRDILSGWLDDELAVVLAYVLAQEVEAVFDMRDDRLFC